MTGPLHPGPPSESGTNSHGNAAVLPPGTTALELAIRRNQLAADRTLLAWIRTAVALIAFGFTIYKVMDSLIRAGVASMPRPQGPRNLGLALVATGTFSLLAAIIVYRKYILLLTRERPFGIWKVTMATALVVVLVGLLVLVSVVTQTGVF